MKKELLINQKMENNGMRNLILNAFMAGGMLLLSAQANAGFIKTDWKIAGDQRAMLHEETGIEWLSLPETSGMSINQVKALLDSTFTGWRLPTKSEVTQMLSASLGVNLPATAWNSAAFNTNVAQYTSNIGASYVNTPGQPGAVHSWAYTQSYAMFLDELGRVNFSGVYDVTWNSTTHAYSNNLVGSDENYKIYAYSVFLVSDGGTTLSSKLDPTLNINNPNAPADVGEPGLFALLSCGLLFLRRRSLKIA